MKYKVYKVCFDTKCNCSSLEKCMVHSVSRTHTHKGFKVSAKLCLNLHVFVND